MTNWDNEHYTMFLLKKNCNSIDFIKKDEDPYLINCQMFDFWIYILKSYQAYIDLKLLNQRNIFSSAYENFFVNLDIDNKDIGNKSSFNNQIFNYFWYNYSNCIDLYLTDKLKKETFYLTDIDKIFIEKFYNQNVKNMFKKRYFWELNDLKNITISEESFRLFFENIVLLNKNIIYKDDKVYKFLENNHLIEYSNWQKVLLQRIAQVKKIDPNITLEELLEMKIDCLPLDYHKDFFGLLGKEYLMGSAKTYLTILEHSTIFRLVENLKNYEKIKGA